MSTFAKRMITLLAVCLLACGLCLAAATAAIVAAASEELDPSRSCSLSIVFREDGGPVRGGDLTLFRVGEVTGSGDSLRYTLTKQFAGSGVALAELSNDSLAKILAEYALQQRIEGETQDIGDDGIAHYDGLTVGVYLVVQFNAAEGYYPIRPFLISLPSTEQEQYVYDVEAAPKVEPIKGGGPDDSSGGSSDNSSDSSDDSSLPQSGQLQWPIPILTVVGLVLIVCGWLLVFGIRNRRSS